MKIKLDENLPFRLAALLKNLGHDVHTAYEERLVARPDKEIWDAAQKESRFLITQDLDFSDLRRFAPGSHHGILLVRLRAPNRRSLTIRIEELFQQENVRNGQAVSLSLQSARLECANPRSNRFPLRCGLVSESLRAYYEPESPRNLRLQLDRFRKGVRR